MRTTDEVAGGWWLVASEEASTAGPRRLAGIDSRFSFFVTSPQPLTPSPYSRGFTLTEILVVITILAILAALGTVGVLRALDTAKQTRIKVEVDNIDAAFKSYKEKYGSYPPCDLYYDGPTGERFRALMSHIARAFPRYNMGANGVNLHNDLLAVGLDSMYTRPDQALVFWLRGFSADPANPFITVDGRQIVGGTAGAKASIAPLFDFDQGRLKNINLGAGGSYPSYIPPGLKQDIPYVYFDSAQYNSRVTTGSGFSALYSWDGGGSSATTAGKVTPYITDVDGNGMVTAGTPSIDKFVNPDTYQIIACGLDGKFGKSVTPDHRFYPNGIGPGWSLADDDNVANFCERSRLGDAKP
jgi:prepilin-type N-terminal cleavage/methylation domain-containing protein